MAKTAQQWPDTFAECIFIPWIQCLHFFIIPKLSSFGKKFQSIRHLFIHAALGVHKHFTIKMLAYLNATIAWFYLANNWQIGRVLMLFMKECSKEDRYTLE